MKIFSKKRVVLAMGLKAGFNDHVKKGQGLLKLDPPLFSAQIGQVEASVASAQASMLLAQSNFERNERLVGQNYVSALTPGPRRW